MNAKLELISQARQHEAGHENDANPLLRRIPNPSTEQELVRLLARDPFRSPEFKARPPHPRKLIDYLRSVVVPTPSTMRIARSLLDLVHNGYDRRDPGHPAVWSSFFQTDDGFGSGDSGPVLTDAVTIAGITGLGKSHLIRQVLSTMPQTIRHDELGGRLKGVTQIVWIYLEMGTASGLEGLLMDLLKAIDSALGIQEYQRQFESSRVNVDRMINTVIRALKTHFCGVLVFDEIQKLNFGQKQASERVRGLMLKLLNSGVPLVLAGNPRGLQFKGKDGVSAQLTRRLRANGEFRLDPADSPSDVDWNLLVRGLWRCQLLPEREELTSEHLELIYRATGGFPVCLAHLLGYSQQLAIEAGESKVTPAMLERAAATCPMLKSMRSLIRGIVERDPLLLAQHEDVDADHFQRKWQQTGYPAASEGGEGVSSSSAPSVDKPARSKDRAVPVRRKQRSEPAKEVRAENPAGAHLLSEVEALIRSAKDGQT